MRRKTTISLGSTTKLARESHPSPNFDLKSDHLHALVLQRKSQHPRMPFATRLFGFTKGRPLDLAESTDSFHVALRFQADLVERVIDENGKCTLFSSSDQTIH